MHAFLVESDDAVAGSSPMFECVIAFDVNRARLNRYVHLHLPHHVAWGRADKESCLVGGWDGASAVRSKGTAAGVEILSLSCVTGVSLPG